MKVCFVNERLGEYFARLDDAEDLAEFLFVISYDGEMQDNAIARYRYWTPLLAHVVDVISEFQGQPFLGPATCAMVMDFAAKRLAAQENKRVPVEWFATIKTLRSLRQ